MEEARAAGEWLKSQRLASGMTQEELAGKSGLSVRAISNLERGRTARPHPQSLKVLAVALGLPETAGTVWAARLRADRARGASPQASPDLPAGEPANPDAAASPEPAEQLRLQVPEDRFNAGLRLGLLQEQIPQLLEGYAGVPGRADGIRPDGTPLTASGTASPGSATAPVPRQLPAAVRSFVGRQAEVDKLGDLVAEAAGAEGTVAILAIDGMPGVGKTALAVHFAHRTAARFPDGQLYVDLRGFSPSSPPVHPAQAISGFLSGLGVSPQEIPGDADARAALYRSLLSGKRVLILLDNAHDAAQVRPLLPAAQGCLVLATSRSQLTGLAAADGARLLTLGVLSDAEATELLAARLGLPRVAAEPDAVAEVTRLCARLPLALTIAAAGEASRPPRSLAALAAELRGTPLDALDAGEPASNVRAVFTWSYRHLSDPAARMLRLLCLLHPGPDISLAAVTSLAGIPSSEGRRALRELAAASMLTEHVPGRYACHDLLREYAAEQTDATSGPGEHAAAAQRLLGYYQRTVASLLRPAAAVVQDPKITPERFSDPAQALAWFEAMYQMLLTSITRATDARFDISPWKISWPMVDFLRRYSEWRDPAAVLRAQAAHPGDSAGMAAVLIHAAVTGAVFADYATARNGLQDSLSLYRELGDRAGEARVQQRLGWLSACQDRCPEALTHAGKALTAFRDGEDRAGQVATLNFIAWCHIRTGEYRPAQETCQQSLDLCRQAELPRRSHTMAQALESLGDALHHLGQHAEAGAHYESALAIFGEHGDRLGEAGTLGRLGRYHSAAGQPRMASEAWGQALLILDSLHHPDARQIRDQARAAGIVPGSRHRR